MVPSPRQVEDEQKTKERLKETICCEDKKPIWQYSVDIISVINDKDLEDIAKTPKHQAVLEQNCFLNSLLRHFCSGCVY